MDRNIAILNLLIDYGLSLQELTALTMHHVHFETNTLSIPATAGVERTITLTHEDKKQLYTYYKSIPEPVRPKYHSNDPLFVAFDFNRGTYRWVYENDAPKGLTEAAHENAKAFHDNKKTIDDYKTESGCQLQNLDN